MDRLLEYGSLRIGASVLVVLLTVAGSAMLSGWLDFGVLGHGLGAALAGDASAIGRADFAFALAGLIVALALGLALSFGLCAVLPLWLGLRRARRSLEAVLPRNPETDAADRVALAANLDALDRRLRVMPVIGAGWRQFAATLDRSDERQVAAPVRPQAILHAGLAREALPGLGLMGAVPGWFVGAGLLLTFLGIVLALDQAGATTAAGSAEAMQSGISQLLQVSTFKFATSIAGLAASLALSIVFRCYWMALDAGFARLCAALERGLVPMPAAAAQGRVNALLERQLGALETVAPAMEEALARRLVPFVRSMELVVSRMGERNEASLDRLGSGIRESLTQGAGEEMRALAASLAQMKDALSAINSNLTGGGADLARALGSSTERLETTLSQAGEGLERNLAQAGAGATQRFEAALSGAMTSLDQRMGGLAGTLEALRGAMAEQMGAVGRQALDAQAAAGASLTAAGEAAASRLRGGVEDAMAGLSANVAGIGQTTVALRDMLERLDRTMETQSRSLERSADATQLMLAVFDETARALREAAQPLGGASERFATASETMAKGVENSLGAIEHSRTAIQMLAGSLREANGETRLAWTRMQERLGELGVEMAGPFEPANRAQPRATVTPLAEVRR